MTNQPSHLRPWSTVDDEELKALREIADRMRDLVDGIDDDVEVFEGMGHLYLNVADIRDLIRQVPSVASRPKRLTHEQKVAKAMEDAGIKPWTNVKRWPRDFR